LSFFCFFGRSETGAANPGVGGSTPPLGASKTNGLAPFVFLFLVVFFVFSVVRRRGRQIPASSFASARFKSERFAAVRSAFRGVVLGGAFRLFSVRLRPRCLIIGVLFREDRPFFATLPTLGGVATNDKKRRFQPFRLIFFSPTI